MSKINRQAVHQMYGGRCAYCGKVIALKEMQVDHYWPECRSARYNGDINCMDNLKPSCRSCNHYKRDSPPEFFREMMKSIHQRLATIYIFKVAADYGIVEIKPFDGRFYFESIQQ